MNKQLNQTDVVFSGLFFSQKLQEENGKLKSRVQTLEGDLSECNKSRGSTEDELREKVRSLTTENKTISRRLRELNIQLTALQAKSPEVES